MEQLQSFVSSQDLSGLTELWKHFQLKLFRRLESQQAAAVRKLETSLFKLYCCTCVTARYKVMHCLQWDGYG